jgi:hypothetical protein
MPRHSLRTCALLFACFLPARATVSAQQAAATPAPSPQPSPQQARAFDEWADAFDGDKLDESKWERFSFEGGGGGKLEVKGGELRLRSGGGTRAGVRSREEFAGEQFSVEARVAKVGPAYPDPNQKGEPLGFAALTILFDGSGRNRVEWVLTSAGRFEAWAVVDGRAEQLDDRNLGTKMKNPVIAIVRRGDEFLFVLNGPDSPPQDAQVGLRKTVKNLPRRFRVMLYGFSSSENNWDAVRVVTPRRQ